MNCKLFSIMMKSGNVRQVSKKNRNGTRIVVLIKLRILSVCSLTLQVLPSVDGLLTGTGGATLT